MSLITWLQGIMLPNGGTMTRFGPVVCVCSLVVFVSIFITQRCVLGRSDGNIPAEFSPQMFEAVSLNSSIVFATIFFFSLTESFSSKGAQLTCSMLSCTISLIAASSHFLTGMGFSPITFHKHPKSILIIHAKWAEWMTCVPLLIFVLGHITQVRPKYVFGGMALQFVTILVGYLAELSHNIFTKIWCFTIAFSMLLFLIACIYVLSVTLSYHRFVMQQSRRTQTIVLNQTMIRVLGCSSIALWLAFPITFALFFTEAISLRMYTLSAPFFDVVAKAVFIAILNTIYCEGETKRIEAIVQELRTDNEIQTKFLRFVYHEIRNPFNSIMLGLNHLEEEEPLLPYRELIVMLRRSATAMNRVIDDVVELTQARGMLLVNEPTNVEAVLECALETFSSLASEKAIEIVQDVSRAFPDWLMADATKLKKLFEVLISNAIKFSPSNSTITVSLQVVDITFGIVTIAFSVQDSGPGIPDNIAPLLFQPFCVVRPGDFSEDENRGSGLGLCFAKHLADLMNGTLSFAKNRGPGVGTTFFLNISLETCRPEAHSNESSLWNLLTGARTENHESLASIVDARIHTHNVTRSGNNQSKVIPHNRPLPRANTVQIQRSQRPRPRFISNPFQSNENSPAHGEPQHPTRPSYVSNPFQSKGNSPRNNETHRSSLDRRKSLELATRPRFISNPFQQKSHPGASSEVANGLLDSNQNATYVSSRDSQATLTLQNRDPASQISAVYSKKLGVSLAPAKQTGVFEKPVEFSCVASSRKSLPAPAADGTFHSIISNDQYKEFIEEHSDLESSGAVSASHKVKQPARKTFEKLESFENKHFRTDSSEQLLRSKEFSPGLFANPSCQMKVESQPQDKSPSGQDSDIRFATQHGLASHDGSIADHQKSRQLMTDLKLNEVFAVERSNHPSSSLSQTHTSKDSPMTAKQSSRYVTFGTSGTLSEGKKEHKGILTHRDRRRTSLARSSVAQMPSQDLPEPLPEGGGGGEVQKKQGAQVLIVDDVKSNLKLVHLILQKAGYTCDLANDGQEAVDKARQHQYQLIIMDNVMPIMDGVQATRQITAFDKIVAVVGLTGNILQKDQQEFLQAGARFIIEKPANKARLLDACQQFVL